MKLRLGNIRMSEINPLMYINFRMWDWAIWYKHAYKHLGFPSCTPEGRIAQDGGLTSASTAGRDMPENPNAEEIAGLINILATKNNEMAKVIKVRYLSENVSREMKQLNMTRTTFYSRLKEAQMWIYGRLAKND